MEASRLSKLVHQVISLQGRVEDLENQVAILKQGRIEQQLMDHIINLRTRVSALEEGR